MKVNEKIEANQNVTRKIYWKIQLAVLTGIVIASPQMVLAHTSNQVLSESEMNQELNDLFEQGRQGAMPMPVSSTSTMAEA